MRAFSAISCCLLLTASAAASADVLRVIDFSQGVFTVQHGQVFVAGGSPTTIQDRLLEAGSPTAACWHIEVAADAPRDGLAAIIPLYDNRSGHRERKLLDARPAGHCCIRLIGALGGRQVHVDGVAGIAQTPDQPHVRLGTVESSALVAEEWRTLSFRLDPAEDVLSALGGVQLRFSGDGPAWLAVSAVWFAQEPGDPPGVTHGAGGTRSLRTAMWVWHTARIATDTGEIAALIEFSRRHEVTDFYLQMPYEYVDGAVRLLHTDGLRSLNTQAAAAGIRVHALDGAPRYVLSENHLRMLALVDALAAFNAAAPPEARFSAVHLDNEPYVLEGWRDPAKRKAILSEYLALNEALSRQVRSKGLEFGVDIPFWWDAENADGTPQFTVETRQGRVPLLEALFRLVDNVGIMSYRQRVTGPNGVIGCCTGEFELGLRHEVEVLAAVELGTGPDVEPGISFGELPLAYFRGQWHTLKRALVSAPGCAGVALHYYSHFRRWEQESS